MEEQAGGAQDPRTSCGKTSPTCESKTSTFREILAEESRWTRAGTEAKADLAEEKTESILGIQEKS